jgi:hypothetical protein
MTEQTLVPGTIAAGPGPRAGRWRAGLVLVALTVGIAAAIALTVLLAPTAGAAGGCGGG